MKKGFLKILTIVISLVIISHLSFSEMPKLVVDETELVKVDIRVFDFDDDEVSVEYGRPLNSSGEWQTTYGDYGRYVIDIAASDGKLKTVQKFELTVNKVNWPPKLEDLKDITINEGDIIIITPKVIDDNEEEIKIYFSEPIDDYGKWETSYEDAGEYEISVVASDGEFKVNDSFILTIKDVNRKPKMDSYFPKKDYLEIEEDSFADFGVEASDPEGEDIKYIWELDGEQVGKEGLFSYYADYDAAGEHIVRVFVSDKINTIEHSWNIKVLNKNRAPVLEEIEDIVVNENETIEIEIPAYDPDGDIIYYTISEPIGDDKKWDIGFEDAGKYIIDFVVSDGENEVKGSFKIIVNNVDRAPVFEEIEDQLISEGGELIIKLNAYDPDGDKVEFTLEGVPKDAELINNLFVYSPDYDAVKKSTNVVYNLLRLDQLMNNREAYSMVFTARANNLEAKQDVKLTVIDKNQAPVLEEIEDIVVNELETVRIDPKAADEDAVYFTISDPIGNDGVWKTSYEDAGEYEISVVASDGRESVEKRFILTVENVNRAPEVQLAGEINVNENEYLEYYLDAYDADGDEVYLSVEDAPFGEIIDNKLILNLSYDAASKKNKNFLNKLVSKFPSLNRALSSNSEAYNISLIATDGLEIIEKGTTIVVKDVNQIPVLNDAKPEYSQFVTHVGSAVTFSIDASDADGDNLSYRWDFGGPKKYKDITKVKRVWTKPGMKTVKVYISDGYVNLIKIWKVKVLPKEKA